MHPALAIIKRIRTLVAEAAPASKLYLFRTQTLDDTELPAHVIDSPSDTPLPSENTFTATCSVLTVIVTTKDSGTDEQSLAEAMFAHRQILEVALLAEKALNLDYASEVVSQGVPQFKGESEAGRFTREMVTVWQIAYRTDKSNPNVPDVP